MPDRAPLLATRPATEQDLPWLALLRHGPDAAPPDGEALAALRVLLDGGAIVLVDGLPGGLLRVHRGSRDWAIQQVQLLPQYRRAGIGSRLIAEVLAEAQHARRLSAATAVKLARWTIPPCPKPGSRAPAHSPPAAAAACWG
ncbi:GNAT family N-acetyltransferase [Rubrivivax gelatinosus]|uniref:GNAT family N-acetyltransferase n=1 Tax=Rubrivivax gelatinosus TaxID=28068 RepID=UPI0002EFD8B4|nr:GNAT family N-acetyltransferase [Rubrivivax gelatinosus]